MAGLAPLDDETSGQFEAYISLFLRWNARLNLSAVRDEEGILSRHFIESIAVARNLPLGISTLLDFGSGAGLPGIPIALCRPEIVVTLAESQSKKAAFLQEVVRILGIEAKIHAQRAEVLRTVFDCATMRAVDKMPKAVAEAVRLLVPQGWLALMTTRAELATLQAAAGAQISWSEPVVLPFAVDRVLVLGRRIPSVA
ncbi:MAG: 16S rRNA (guanine(527)-N(7))-methyltransferase RsmG [Terracidiphilus sp.]